MNWRMVIPSSRLTIASTAASPKTLRARIIGRTPLFQSLRLRVPIWVAFNTSSLAKDSQLPAKNLLIQRLGGVFPNGVIGRQRLVLGDMQ
jgi:hypothetical protein